MRISDAVHAFLVQRSKETGQSISALCGLYITEYIEAKKGLDSISDLLNAYKTEVSKTKAPAKGLDIDHAKTHQGVPQSDGERGDKE